MFQEWDLSSNVTDAVDTVLVCVLVYMRVGVCVGVCARVCVLVCVSCLSFPMRRPMQRSGSMGLRHVRVIGLLGLCVQSMASQGTHFQVFRTILETASYHEQVVAAVTAKNPAVKVGC